MTTKKELQLYLDEKYPDLHLHVQNDCRQFSILKTKILLETSFYLDNTESLSHVEPRLLKALTYAKELIEHSIDKINE